MIMSFLEFSQSCWFFLEIGCNLVIVVLIMSLLLNRHVESVLIGEIKCCFFSAGDIASQCQVVTQVVIFQLTVLSGSHLVLNNCLVVLVLFSFPDFSELAS